MVLEYTSIGSLVTEYNLMEETKKENYKLSVCIVPYKLF